MLPAGTMSIDNGTKSVTYNAPINRGGERGESRTFFVFRVLFFPFSRPPARSDRAPERERVCMVESEEERERGKILGWSRGMDPALKSREGNSTAAHLCCEVWAFLPI